MRITTEQLEALKSNKGGFTKATLVTLGAWPPKKGWKKRLLVNGFSPSEVEKKSQTAKKKKHEKKHRKKIRAAECKAAKVGDVNSKGFLESYAWRKLRMKVLKAYGARCQCCGRSRLHDVVIHVDHIKPRRKHPELALEFSNLQVLCDECNHGKGNWDETDWREPQLAVLMGERMDEP